MLLNGHFSCTLLAKTNNVSGQVTHKGKHITHYTKKKLYFEVPTLQRRKF